ncbi:hypothetical protein ACF1BP_24245 [Streptomyces sp. NPDC014735]|uniref:hypothetical protein n=1 Tax=Streptomyces sp. NPDC014735 TaxID=3364887 RepID=UPI0036F82CEC
MPTGVRRVVCPSWQERALLIEEAATRLAEGTAGSWKAACRQVETELPAQGVPERAGTAGPVVRRPGVLYQGELAERWAALRAAADTWPLLAPSSGPVSWPEQARRNPWR